MQGGGDWTTLKRGAHRSVFRTPPQADGAARLVKRFRSRGRIGRLFDGRRARREAHVLARLHAAGLPVPAPLALHHGEEGWELWCEWIPDAVTLAEVIEGVAPWPRSARALAPELGRLLARAHRSGLVHPDLHPGNVLVDARGELWLVDFTKARFVRGLRAGQRERELVLLEAATREVLPFSIRARCLRAWRAELGGDVDSREALAARIAARGRAERRAMLARERDRWLRTSSRCVRERMDEAFVVVRRGAAALTSSELEALLNAPHDEAVHAEAGARFARASVVRAGSGVRADWLELGRAVDHHLPAMLPLALLPGARSRALFERPPGAHPLEHACEADARSAGWLAGSLLDRGLALAVDPSACCVVTQSGALMLAPGVRFVALTKGPELAVAPLRRFVDAHAGLRATEFERGLRSALRRDPGLRRAAGATRPDA